MDKNQITFVSPLLMFLMGGLVGAAVMVILAPQSGADTRHMLASRSHDLKERAVESTTKTGKAVGELVSGARDRATNILNRGEDLASKVKSNIEDEAKAKYTLFGQAAQ